MWLNDLLTLLDIHGDLKNVNCYHCAHLRKNWSGLSILHWYLFFPVQSFLSELKACQTNPETPVTVFYAPFIHIFGKLWKIWHKNKIKLTTLGFVKKSLSVVKLFLQEKSNKIGYIVCHLVKPSINIILILYLIQYL